MSPPADISHQLVSLPVDIESVICPLSRDTSTEIRPPSRYAFFDLQRSDLRFLDLVIYQWLRSPDADLRTCCSLLTFTTLTVVTAIGSIRSLMLFASLSKAAFPSARPFLIITRERTLPHLEAFPVPLFQSCHSLIARLSTIHVYLNM